jgi:hypothetical protein
VQSRGRPYIGCFQDILNPRFTPRGQAFDQFFAVFFMQHPAPLQVRKRIQNPYVIELFVTHLEQRAPFSR